MHIPALQNGLSSNISHMKKTKMRIGRGKCYIEKIIKMLRVLCLEPKGTGSDPKSDTC